MDDTQDDQIDDLLETLEMALHRRTVWQRNQHSSFAWDAYVEARRKVGAVLDNIIHDRMARYMRRQHNGPQP